ncbi:glycosyltransferase family 39 protein [Microcoleus sp. FACHB-672]|uniref:glycosyltransferase family 39 protein n=1 Tax=Microcoleus sp. FACHB-672 TaxID=2692825 RepID=UPI001686C46A|nr:glycosyltransferase family 39 protein [Microcoleus sp. FACHB-672]MBD2042062.1 glycosyltransferase family 39 protein [Microcoleus sp. FACHB-672]
MTRKFRFLIIVLLLLGIFFRFLNLDRKFYWYDETFTSLRISGYTETEVVRQVANGKLISIPELHKYQRPNPEKGVIDTIQGLAVEEPQLTPLYFVMAQFWARTFGDSVPVIRSLSALISLLVFPSIYWLCLELFKSSVVGSLAMALIAVSPFHVLYAQEARPYSLWTVMILISSASLLRAMRLKHASSWAIYGIVVAVGLYSHLLLILVVIAHGFYVVVTERWRWNKTIASFMLASSGALLSFSPWMAVVINNSTEVHDRTNWSYLKITWISLFNNWIINIVRGYFDFGFTSESVGVFFIPLSLLILILLIIIGFSIYFLKNQMSKNNFLFILTLILIPGLAIIIPDLISGGVRSTKSRYLIPSYLGIRLAITYLLTSQILFPSAKSRQHKLWKIITVVLISSGILSCAISSQSDTWWNKEWGSQNPQIARTINRSLKPLVISNLSDASIGNVFSLSYLLESKAQFQLVVKSNIPEISQGFSDIFIYGFYKKNRENLTKKLGFKLETIYSNKNAGIGLWKLVK